MGKSAPGDGFEVDPARLDGVAGELGRCYDDFSEAAQEFSRGGSGSSFGAIQGAWASFDSAWSDELLTTKTAIAELIGKVSSTADTYRDADYQVGKLIRNTLGTLGELL